MADDDDLPPTLEPEVTPSHENTDTSEVCEQFDSCNLFFEPSHLNNFVQDNPDLLDSKSTKSYMFIHDPHTPLVVHSAKPIHSKYHRLAIYKLIPIFMDVDTDDAYPSVCDFDSSRPRYIFNVSYSNFSQLPHLLAKSKFVLHRSDEDYRPMKQIKFGHTNSEWASSIAECFADFTNQGLVVEGGKKDVLD